MSGLLTPAVRRWVYGIAIAVLPLLIAYGVLDDQSAPLWAALVGAVLVPSLAVANVQPGTGRRIRED